MKPEIFNSKVKEIDYVTPSVILLSLSVPKEIGKIDFKPGQYFSMSVPREDGKKIRKLFSIVNVTSEGNNIEFLIKLIPGGLASEFVKKLKVRDEVELFGPVGKFTIPEDYDKDLIFIASGVGVAPFVSMICDLLGNRNFQKKIVLIKSARNEDEILSDDLFSRLEEENKNFEFYNVLSRPKNNNFECVGYVQDFLERYVPEKFEGNFYVCGLKEMIEKVKEKLLELDFSEENVFYEKFY